MLVTIGRRSSIARAVVKNYDGKRNDSDLIDDATPLDGDQYLICSGYLAGKNLLEIDFDEANETWHANYIAICTFLDKLFDQNPYARVCVIGSHSGFEGSHDMAYAGAKAALHTYIETKRLKHGKQLLVGLAPHIIWDSGMTQKRDDLAELQKRSLENRTNWWLTSAEVANIASYVLFNAPTTISNQIIRIRP